MEEEEGEVEEEEEREHQGIVESEDEGFKEDAFSESANTEIERVE